LTLLEPFITKFIDTDYLIGFTKSFSEATGVIEIVEEVYQGKLNMTTREVKKGIAGFRPYQIGVCFKMKTSGC